MRVRKKQLKIIAEQIEQQFLPYVRRPSRYIGGEVNQIKKRADGCDLNVALCFPDVYEIGMSHTGLAIIYEVLNRIENVSAERVFSPWIDAEPILRNEKLPLFSLESKADLSSFDVIGFSLTNELCYTNVLNMLDLAGLEIRSNNRGEDDPLVIAGGTMANCCEPMAEFIDLFILGEAEDAVVKLSEFIIESRKLGKNKSEMLIEAARRFDWAYVPSLYQFEYKDGDISNIRVTDENIKIERTTAVVDDFENAVIPPRPIVPFAEAVHERVSIEIMRGCPGRCRFCQASFCRRPIRFRSVERIVDAAKKAYEATGFDTVSLLSLSTADYPKLEELIAALNEYFHDKHVGISVPSLRVDSQLMTVPQLLQSVRKSGLTIAVEAASEKVRMVINKPIKDSDLFATVEAAYRGGWQKLKLYFMVGLPGEKESDIVRIVELSNELALLRRKIDNRVANINVAVSWFVPKPHTPFEWVSQMSRDYFENAKRTILDTKMKLRAKYLLFKFHNIERTILESAIGRGDRRLCSVIETAWRNGARFDLWDECFNFQIWQKAFEQHDFDAEKSASRQYTKKQILAWGHLGGPDREYLLDHYDKAQQILANASFD
ncbi:MAG: TIGR03960 family B12-binding radical SAM protein [Phycisphaerae bacterium]|jgi:radical SAM family uncharacterized protein